MEGRTRTIRHPNIILASVVALLALAVVPTTSQVYHDPVYVAGGYQASIASANHAPGIWIVRADGSAATAALPGYATYGFCMDVDNRHLVVSCAGATAPGYKAPQFGLFRFDPNTLAFTTLYGPDTVTFYSVSGLHIDQDGDYVFNAATRIGQTRYTDHKVLKFRFGSGLSTIFHSSMVGRPAYSWGAITTDIDTGSVLVCDTYATSSFYYPVYAIAPNGSVTTWSQGAPYGWQGTHQIQQNHTTGHLETPQNGFIYQLKRTGGRTTLATLRLNWGPVYGQRNFRYDLQSAPQKRWVGTMAPSLVRPYATWLHHVDSAGIVTSTHVSGVGARMLVENDFAFYRGNHLQTLRVGRDRWQIRLSCPKFPGAAYALAAGASGVRPGLRLPDGRRIHLNLDPLVQATLHNRLPGLWNPGPGVLDKNGEAQGMLDLSILGRPSRGFGIPIWITLLILDPKAPLGIRYVPDTRVLQF